MWQSHAPGGRASFGFFGLGSGSTVPAHGLRDASLSKFDSAGNFQWAKTWGGNGDDLGLGVAADGAGNVLVVGSFQNTVDFDPGSGVDNRTALGGQDAFFTIFRLAVLDHTSYLPFTQRH